MVIKLHKKQTFIEDRYLPIRFSVMYYDNMKTIIILRMKIN